MSEPTTTKPTTPTYAEPDEVLAWKSPAPLQFDYQHSETEQWFRVEGICKSKDKKGIYAEIARLSDDDLRATLPLAIGYVPSDSDLADACYCAACIKAPAMTALQWLIFGAEASLGELSTQTLIASRMVEVKNDKDTGAKIPDGVEAAKAEMKADPLEPTPGGEPTAGSI